MGIGTSIGAFHEDDFRHVAAPWFLDPKDESKDNNTKTPDQVEIDKQLDQVDITELGGIEM